MKDEPNGEVTCPIDLPMSKPRCPALPHPDLPSRPNDAADLPEVTRAIYVGTGGDLTVRMLTGETLTFTGIAPASLLPVRAARILATGTTAGNLVGLA